VPNYVNVKYSAGPNPPTGWPVEMTEPVNQPSPPALLPGFDDVVTAAALVATRNNLQATYDAWAAAQAADPVRITNRKLALASRIDADPLALAVFRMLWDMSNRLLTLEGQPTLTKAQFRQQIIDLMD
jgi:hypothetical protein